MRSPPRPRPTPPQAGTTTTWRSRPGTRSAGCWSPSSRGTVWPGWSKPCSEPGGLRRTAAWRGLIKGSTSWPPPGRSGSGTALARRFRPSLRRTGIPAHHHRTDKTRPTVTGEAIVGNVVRRASRHPSFPSARTATDWGPPDSPMCPTLALRPAGGLARRTTFPTTASLISPLRRVNHSRPAGPARAIVGSVVRRAAPLPLIPAARTTIGHRRKPRSAASDGPTRPTLDHPPCRTSDMSDMSDVSDGDRGPRGPARVGASGGEHSRRNDGLVARHPSDHLNPGPVSVTMR